MLHSHFFLAIILAGLAVTMAGFSSSPGLLVAPTGRLAPPATPSTGLDCEKPGGHVLKWNDIAAWLVQTFYASSSNPSSPYYPYVTVTSPNSPTGLNRASVQNQVATGNVPTDIMNNIGNVFCSQQTWNKGRENQGEMPCKLKKATNLRGNPPKVKFECKC